MPGPYVFGQIFAADPSQTDNVATQGSILIFAPGDVAKTPLALTAVDGALTLTNPVTLNANGFGPAFMADIDQVAWEGGGFSGTFESYRGMKDVVLASQSVSEAARAAADKSAEAAATAAAAAGIPMPAGGLQGQTLVKKSDIDFAVEWKTPSSGGGSDTGGSVQYVRGDSTAPRPTSSRTVMVIFLTTGPTPPVNAVPDLDMWIQV